MSRHACSVYIRMVELSDDGRLDVLVRLVLMTKSVQR